MHRTITEATVKAIHHDTLDSLAAHLAAFVTAYDFATHLKSLRRRTPFQAVFDAWSRGPAPFNGLLENSRG